MANNEHLVILKSGKKEWNKWREENPKEKPDLCGANLKGANLGIAVLIKADLRGADLSRADLSRSSFHRADLRGANLSRAAFNQTELIEADLRGANLREAYLIEADLSGAVLSKANFIRADLRGASFIKADLTNCRTYGISAWNLKIDKATVQSDMVISKKDEPIITVDNIEVAQFIYLMLKNEKIRNIIDTITMKVVLILGRFTPKRKAILDAIREELRKLDYIPVLFDFEKPASKDIHETVTTLARLAKFIIADITSPKSIPQELTSIVPVNPSVPVKPIIEKGSKPWGMFGHIRKYPWVLDVHEYKNLEDLISSLKKKVIIPAEAKIEEIRKK